MIYVKDTTWKQVDIVSVKTGGTWVMPIAVSVKNDGVWEKVWAAHIEDVSLFSYDTSSAPLTDKDVVPSSMYFTPDGTKFYMLGPYSDSVHQYSLSSAWDISTFAYNNSYNVAAQEAYPKGFCFSPAGTKLYVVGQDNDTVYQYSLSSAWDVSTATYDNKSKSVAAQDTGPQALRFNPTGTKMYVVGGVSDTVFQYSLSSAWDVSTATYDNKSLPSVGEYPQPSDVVFSHDGLKIYVSDGHPDAVLQYSLSSAWDVSTATYDNKSLPWGDDYAQAIWVRPDGNALYMLQDGEVRQFLL